MCQRPRVRRELKLHSTVLKNKGKMKLKLLFAASYLACHWTALADIIRALIRLSVCLLRRALWPNGARWIHSCTGTLIGTRPRRFRICNDLTLDDSIGFISESSLASYAFRRRVCIIRLATIKRNSRACKP